MNIDKSKSISTYTTFPLYIEASNKRTCNSMTPTPLLSDLPLEIWVKISVHLDREDVFALALTCHQFYGTMTSDSVWWPKIRKNWYMSDYDPVSLVYKKKLKSNESCFQYFRRKKNEDRFLRSLIDDILNYTPFANNEKQVRQQEASIQNRLLLVYQNFDNFVPCLLSESLHITSSIYHSSSNSSALGNERFALADDFLWLQKKRNAKLGRIYVASSILEAGKFWKCLSFYKRMELDDLPDDLETVFVQLSLLDSRYYELILQRHAVIKTVIYNFNAFNFEENTRPPEKILALVTILHRVIESKKRQILRYERNVNKATVEDLSVLRFYCGDSEGSPLVKNSVVAKLCQIVGLDKYIDMNEWCIRIFDENRYLYLLIDDRQMYLKREDQVPEILRRFPMNDPGSILHRHLEGSNDSLNIENKKSLFIGKFLNFYDGYQSRLDDLRGADQIIYQMRNDEKIVTVHRGDYIQGQILGCGGYVNVKAWNALQLILTNGLFSDERNKKNAILGFASIFNMPILQMLSVDIPFSFKALFLRDISYDLKISELGKAEELDILWESEQLSIGDVVWSDASQARGIIVEICDSFEDDQHGKIGLFSATTYKGRSCSLRGSPLYTIFFGAYGYATFSRQYLKKDKTDRVEGLLVYDLVGRWFSHYDYDMHKFLYRHGAIL